MWRRLWKEFVSLGQVPVIYMITFLIMICSGGRCQSSARLLADAWPNLQPSLVSILRNLVAQDGERFTIGLAKCQHSKHMHVTMSKLALKVALLRGITTTASFTTRLVGHRQLRWVAGPAMFLTQCLTVPQTVTAQPCTAQPVACSRIEQATEFMLRSRNGEANQVMPPCQGEGNCQLPVACTRGCTCMQPYGF